MRIYPGYLVAYIFSLLAIGPLSGGHLSWSAQYPAHIVFDMALLKEPTLNGSFSGAPFQDLNGSMWTIAYEFRCYLLAMVLGTFGIFRFRKVFLSLAIALLLVLFILPGSASADRIDFTFESVRFCALFCCGGVFFLFRDRITYSRGWVLATAVALTPLMFYPRFAHIAWAVLGGYLLFWFALRAKANVLSRLDNRFDLSYGLYLYAWPIQELLIWRFHINSPWLLFAAAMIPTSILAAVSWILVERPCMDLHQRASIESSPLTTA